jgi:septal ring factor EnvC (AmiA/AmiB activator)
MLTILVATAALCVIAWQRRAMEQLRSEFAIFSEHRDQAWDYANASEETIKQLKLDLEHSNRELSACRKDLEAMGIMNQSYAAEIDQHRTTLAYVVNMIENRHRIVEISNEHE